ncbi:MAG TPA: hypothetical protein VK327_03690 [Candidatus Paceibacterota bacterium]|nr:hypothetical protein [Candidatus Paceibacterota bacterium]
MDADEKEICTYLKSYPGQFIGLREICRRAGGKWRYRENENWAVPVLVRLVEKGLIEDDRLGHYRLIVQTKKKKNGGRASAPQWISPQIKSILDQSGKVFDIDADENQT